jgi:hypothetical protein
MNFLILCLYLSFQQTQSYRFSTLIYTFASLFTSFLYFIEIYLSDSFLVYRF